MKKPISDFSLKNFLTTNVEISLSNSLSYRTSFSLPSQTIMMKCGYNSRNKGRWIILSDRQGNTLLPQTFLKVNKICELNFNSELLDLDYSLVLLPKRPLKTIGNDYDYINWGNDLAIVFFGNEYSASLRMQKNIRTSLVGN